MEDSHVQKILKDNKEVFDALEEYDRTGILRLKGKIIDVDLENQFKEGLEDLKSAKIRKVA